MKILAAQTHHKEGQMNATDYLRIVSPFAELQKHGYKVDIQSYLLPDALLHQKDPFSKEVLSAYQDIGKKYDLVWSSYNHAGIFFSYLATLRDRGQLKFVYDYDDNLLNLDFTNPVALIERVRDPNEGKKIEVVLRELSNISVTCSYLRDEFKVFRKTNGKEIFVLSNYIDETLYIPQEKKENKKIKIGFYGSVSHQADLHEKDFLRGLSYVYKKYRPHIEIEIVGNFFPQYLESFVPHSLIGGSPDYFEWIKLWKRTVCTWDIAVAPLRDTPFNRSRSELKYLETGAAGVPLVCSDIGVYTSQNALKCRSKQDWINNLSMLIEDGVKRKDTGQKAQDEVLGSLTIQKNWRKWEEKILKII